MLSDQNVPLAICGPGEDAQLEVDLKALAKKGELKTTVDVALRMESAKVYDTAFLLLGLFHIIEWLRTIVLLASTCMGGVWLISLY